MSADLYYLVHFAALALIVGSLGGLAYAPRHPDTGKPPKALTILHGIAILLMLVAGFGLMARRGYNDFPWPSWLFVKLGVWVLLGALPVAMRKSRALRGIVGLLVAAALVAVVGLALTERWA